MLAGSVSALEFEDGLEVHKLAHEDYVGPNNGSLDLNLVVGVVHVQVEL